MIHWMEGYFAIGFFFSVASMMAIPAKRVDTFAVKILAFFFIWAMWPAMAMYKWFM